MPERVAFLLGKDPATARGGDVTMSGLLREIAAERYDTTLICLSDTPGTLDDGVVRVPKPAVSLPALAARSAVRRRSLVHCRFDVDALTAAIEASRADRFVAVHSYMAESYLRSAGADPADGLLVSSEVSEAAVWRSSRGALGRVEVGRLRRDEERVRRAARAVAGYDRDEVDRWTAAGHHAAHWLPLTLPPADTVDIAAAPPRLALLGNRTWAPNAEAADRLVAWWPEISAGIPDAELVLVGAVATHPGALPPGVTDVGEVEDVAAVLGSCRGLAAPIETGGGVRVKMLEAAARGLPVVTTPAGVGAIEAALGITAAAGRDAFVAACRALLLDADAAAAEGARLHRENSRRWAERTGQDAVHRWLAA